MQGIFISGLLKFFRNKDAENVYYLGLKPDKKFHNDLQQLRLALTPIVGANHLTIAYGQSIPLFGFPALLAEERKLKGLFKKEFSKLPSSSVCKISDIFIDELTGSFGYNLIYDEHVEAFLEKSKTLLTKEFDLPSAQIMVRNSKRLVLAKNLPKLILEKVAKENRLNCSNFNIEGVTLKRQTNASKFKIVEQLSWV